MARPDRSRSYRDLAGRSLSVGERLAAGFLFALMAIGSVALWIGVPAASMLAASEIATDSGEHFVATLAITLPGMLLFSWFLFWLNNLYLRITIPPRAPELEEAEEPPQIRGPLEPMLVGSLAIAIVALLVWFFAFAENPPPRLF